jgi:hypothetical protein
MDKWLIVASIVGLSASLSGCPSADYPTCTGPRATSSGGKCSAYYYQTDYGSGGATTQAMTDCQIDSQRLGGNVVAFHTLEHGIGLRWLDATTLEVAVPDGVKLENQRTHDVYLGHALTYRYRSLQPSDSEFSACSPQRQRGGT